MEELGEIVHEFLMESHENLDQLDRDLVALEQEPGSRELISRIFRTIHTIKGTSGFLAFSRLETLTHAGESLLSRLRDGVQPVTPETITTLLAMLDGVRALLATIEESGAEGDINVEGVIASVHRQMSDATGESDAAAPQLDAPTAVPAPESFESDDAEPRVSLDAPPAPTRELPDDKSGRRPLGEMLIESGAISQSDVTWAVQRQVEGDERKLGTILLEEGKAAPAAVGEALQAQNKRSVADSAIRVDVDLLDTLMNLVGELVLARNQLVRGVAETADPALMRTTQRLNLITSELQEGIMKTRMQPIEHLWSKLPRVVRDLANACGKQVKLVMEGKETELDRSLLEAVKDPLTHLVRNAVDHGVETAAERLAAGKDPEGTLTLRAYHEGGHVTVEVADDGCGINVDRVARTAVERGLLRPEQLTNMDPREIMMLIFQPGFSTAAKVTNVSGRGVGMDVVKTNIERIGGAVEVDSTPGAGTTLRLTIPLTLAIIQALTVECAGERYVVPQVAVHELVYIDGQTTKIEYASGAPVYRLRGKLLPLVRLDRALDLPVGGDQNAYVIVLQADGRRFGMVVDRVLNTEEVVVKALTARFKDIGLYAGATILGDGKVALILDVASLARRSHLAAGPAERHAAASALEAAAKTGPVDRLLIAGVGDRRVAIPLDTVTRLEEFTVDRIERAGMREVVQYRDQILPLARLSHLLGVMTELDEERISVVVYTERGRSVALVVDKIVDIVEDTVTARREVDDDGLLGTAVVQQRVTELLDVRRAILAADPNFYTELPDPMLVEA
ncbi:two-component system, chemotaxis family, sensor kinase CheA [Micromonospora pattaloongensis]|uniref:histidine kinase n=1 Tax=Micromonospora pattaloongensis TaxID=405436 RepID=A0A1H3N1W1_9ACTN|nr:chemotaxis protein CheW [Micromonospora pattaloongensis]SDY82219.1 two-component system, chemotaxis family, sensor kinase CheA [Micromonospora pattaloongensis]